MKTRTHSDIQTSVDRESRPGRNIIEVRVGAISLLLATLLLVMCYLFVFTYAQMRLDRLERQVANNHELLVSLTGMMANQTMQGKESTPPGTPPAATELTPDTGIGDER